MIGLAAALLAATIFAGSSSDPFADNYSFASVVSRKLPAGDPGVAPAFVAGDYTPYWKPGPYTLTGSPFVRTSDGRTHACANGLYALVYPSTPYTRWMLLNYLHHIDATGYDIDPAELAGAPSYLQFSVHNPSLVREADCSDGTFTLPNLPAGSYTVLVIIRIPGSESHVVPSTEMVYGGTGEPGTVYHNEIVTSGFWTDGWVVLTPILDVGPQTHNATFGIRSQSWMAMTHIRAPKFTVPPAPKTR